MQKVLIRKLEKISTPLDTPITQGGRIIQDIGELAQIVNGSNFQFLAYLEFKVDSSVLRGNHYHLIKDEFLYVIAGRIQAIYYDLDTNERVERLIEAGDLINVKPRCAHVYFPQEYSQCIEFSPTPYDINDTHKFLVQE